MDEGSAGSQRVEGLLDAAREGDGEALGALLALYQNYLHLMARTQLDLRLHRRASPSDIVQETFLEAARDFKAFQGKSSKELRAWLRRILVNNIYRLVEQQLLAQKRDLRREIPIRAPLASLERSAAAADAGLVSCGPSASSLQERQEMADVIANHLAALPEDDRDLLVLRNLEALPFEDIAKRLSITAGAARMRWLRALERLKGSLEKAGWI